MIVNLIFRGWCSTTGRRFYRLEFQEAYGAWVGFLPLDVESIVNSYGCQSWPASCRRPEYSGSLLRHQKHACRRAGKQKCLSPKWALSSRLRFPLPRHGIYGRLHHYPAAPVLPSLNKLLFDRSSNFKSDKSLLQIGKTMRHSSIYSYS